MAAKQNSLNSLIIRLILRLTPLGPVLRTVPVCSRQTGRYHYPLLPFGRNQQCSILNKLTLLMFVSSLDKTPSVLSG